MRVIDLSTLSMIGGSGIAEAKIPIWFCDGTSMSFNGTNHDYIMDGTTGGSASAVVLFALSANWPSSVKFAFEATIWTNNASYSAYASLYDVTQSFSPTGVTTASTTATVIRGSTLSLTAGHSYGAYINNGNASGTTYISDASLIVFPQ